MGYKQSKMLKIAGIALIIWGIVRGGFSLAGFVTDLYEITSDGVMMIQGFHGGEGIFLLEFISWARLVTSVLLFLLGLIADLIAGAKGIANWKKAEGANRCIVWGGVAMMMNVLVMLDLSFAAGVGSFVIHILYITGAYRLKEQNGQA